MAVWLGSKCGCYKHRTVTSGVLCEACAILRSNLTSGARRQHTGERLHAIPKSYDIEIYRHEQGHGLALYPSALGVQHYRAAWLRPLQRLVGMGGETTLASFPLQTVLSAKLVMQQPGVHSGGCCLHSDTLHYGNY